jgi:hypothetical protein
MCAFSAQILSVTFFSTRNERGMIKMYIDLRVKHPLFLSDCNKTWIFSTVFRKILKYEYSRKPFHWESSCPMRFDRRTDITKLIVAFRNSANPPIKTAVLSLQCTIHSLYTLSAVHWRGKEDIHAVLFVYTDLWPLCEGWKSRVTDSVAL